MGSILRLWTRQTGGGRSTKKHKPAPSRRRERAAAPAPAQPQADDRITPWIDRELDRLKDKDAGDRPEWPLMVVKLNGGEVRAVTRGPKGKSRLLRLAWLARLPDPEGMRVEDLKEALEGRGFDTSATSPVAIDALRPPPLETDAAWQVRRAATEVAFDPGLRFPRYPPPAPPHPPPPHPPKPASPRTAP